MKLQVSIEAGGWDEAHDVAVEADVTWDGEHRFAALSTFCLHCYSQARQFHPEDLTSMERQLAEDLLADEFDRAIFEEHREQLEKLLSKRQAA